MLPLINWLSKHKAVNVVLIGIYYLLAVLPHEQVGVFISKNVRKPMGLEAYDRIMLQIAIGGLLLYGIVVIWNIIKKPKQYPTLIYLIANICFASASVFALFVLNIEAIHFFQYGLLALLLFPLLRSYSATLFWGTILGAIDEAYQYFYLSPDRTDYFDFNDVILDLIGVAFGLILLRSFNPSISKVKSWLNKPIFITSMGIGLLTGLVHLMGWLRFYPDDTAKQAFLLVKKVPTDFWSKVPPNITFHIVQPLEGIILIILLLVFFIGLRFGAADERVDKRLNEK